MRVIAESARKTLDMQKKCFTFVCKPMPFTASMSRGIKVGSTLSSMFFTTVSIVSIMGESFDAATRMSSNWATGNKRGYGEGGQSLLYGHAKCAQNERASRIHDGQAIRKASGAS